MTGLFDQTWAIWKAGGWAMYALAANGLLLFGVGLNIWMKLRWKGHRSVPESTWRAWIAEASGRKGVIGRLIASLMSCRDLGQMGVRFGELRVAELTPIERDLQFMKVTVGTAPLFGLLGTVTGMLVTFQALATGTGGQKTMDLVASGISEALITTETGLVIALPGLFLHYRLRRERDRYDAFLAHLQTLCTQHLFRRLKQEGAAA
jgi:biopolymer transport protein ExbB